MRVGCGKIWSRLIDQASGDVHNLTPLFCVVFLGGQAEALRDVNVPNEAFLSGDKKSQHSSL